MQCINMIFARKPTYILFQIKRLDQPLLGLDYPRMIWQSSVVATMTLQEIEDYVNFAISML